MTIPSAERAAASVAAGGYAVIVGGDDDRGVLVVAAAHAGPEEVAFIVRTARGHVGVALEGSRLDALGLPPLVEPSGGGRTAVTVSVDAAAGAAPGVSAKARAATIATLIDPAAGPADLVRPGYVVPLRVGDGGVLAHRGYAEAAIDLVRIAGGLPAAVLSEVVNPDGTIAGRLDLVALADREAIPVVAVDDIVDHRWSTETVVHRVVTADLPTVHGTFRAYGYESDIDGSEHVALVYGTVAHGRGVLTRVHSECLTGDVFGSSRCDCGQQLNESMRRIVAAGAGVLVYDRRHEGRGIGLLQKLKAYGLQDEGLDTVEANLTLGHPADARHYGTDAQILRDLGVESIRLLTNNPDKIDQLGRLGIVVEDRIPLEIGPSAHNAEYLTAKAEKMGHLLNGTEEHAESGPELPATSHE